MICFRLGKARAFRVFLAHVSHYRSGDQYTFRFLLSDEIRRRFIRHVSHVRASNRVVTKIASLNRDDYAMWRAN